MTTILSQITPQRSTQYSQLAADLAGHELRLSPLGESIVDLAPRRMAGQDFLRVDLTSELDEAGRRELGLLAMTSAHFEYFAELAGLPGPFLRPIETGFSPALPVELVTARRYRGKTNELVTHFLCNIARHSSGYARRPWSELRVFDPLAGGGTTLFTALVLGAECAGVEQDLQTVTSTAAYLRQFCREQRIPYKERAERLRKLGRRWSFAVGKEPSLRCILAQGPTERSEELLAGFKPHLIVTDLPYGIQHQGQLIALLEAALPVWVKLLPQQGSLAFAWDATRFPREQMIDVVQGAAPVAVLDVPPYNELAHRVDRVIKRRDILVLRRCIAPCIERAERSSCRPRRLRSRHRQDTVDRR